MAIVDLQQPSAGGRVIELDDPARRNALTAQMQEELRSAVRTVAEDASARALVIAGRGGSFCAGADLGELFGDRARRMDATRSTLHDVYRAFLAVRELPIPVVAAVEGPAVGAGVNLALACDVRIAGPTARLGVTFSRLGLHPGGGCTYFLVRELGVMSRDVVPG